MVNNENHKFRDYAITLALCHDLGKNDSIKHSYHNAKEDTHEVISGYFVKSVLTKYQKDKHLKEQLFNLLINHHHPTNDYYKSHPLLQLLNRADKLAREQELLLKDKSCG